ncbi:MAG: fibronectin type III domain-containing protein, partial [Thermoplasmata archaeon]
DQISTMELLAAGIASCRFEDTSALPGIVYYYAVAAVNAIGRGVFSDALSGRIPVFPSEPRNLTALPGNMLVSLSWLIPEYPADITGYNLYRSLDGMEWDKIASLAPQITSFIDRDLVNGQTYHYRIAAVNSEGEGNLSATVSCTPSSTSGPRPPGSPLNLISLQGAGFINLSWDPPADDGGAPIHVYRIYRTAGNMQDNQSVELSTSTSCFFNDTTVVPGSSYTYIVRAVNTAGEGNSSKPISVNVPTEQGTSAPSGLSARSGKDFILLSWNAPASGTPSLYQVFRQSNGTLLTMIAEIPSLAYNDTSIIRGDNYTYTVRAVFGTVTGSFSLPVSASTILLPAAPLSLRAEAGSSYVILTWSKPDGQVGEEITGYQVFRQQQGGTEIMIGQPIQTWFNDTSVQEGTFYTYTVRAVCAAGPGDASTPVQVAVPSGQSQNNGTSGSSSLLILIIAAAVLLLVIFLCIVFFIKLRSRAGKEEVEETVGVTEQESPGDTAQEERKEEKKDEKEVEESKDNDIVSKYEDDKEGAGSIPEIEDNNKEKEKEEDKEEETNDETAVRHDDTAEKDGDNESKSEGIEPPPPAE